MKIKMISIIALIACGILVGIITVSRVVSTNNEYNSYLASARSFAEREVPYTSCQNYKKAFAVKCEDEAVYREYIEQAKLLGDSFYDDAISNYVNLFPQSPQAYEDLCTMYYETESYTNVIETALLAKEVGVATEKVKDYYIECYHMYKYIAVDIEEATTFLGNTALVKKAGMYGYLSDSGSYMISPVYEAASPFLGTSAAVNDGTEWYMINQSGYKVARPIVPVDKLSFISNGYILVEKNGKYGYTTTNLEIPENLEYDKASNFKNGIAAVKKGDKWALIDSSMSLITDYIFEDIKLDEYGTCINNGIVFVKKNDKYTMIDAEGKSLSDAEFDDVYPFISAEPAAVCVDKKWGFIDTTGNIVIEPQYTDAKSFSNGLAPVSTNGIWKYINTNNESRIEGQFSDCLPFSSNGIAAVQEGELWSYIKLLAFY